MALVVCLEYKINVERVPGQFHLLPLILKRDKNICHYNDIQLPGNGSRVSSQNVAYIKCT
jgi:hypothetical protein